MSKVIQKKTKPEDFSAVLNGEKHFELRVDEDDAQVGDRLKLREWNGKYYTGREIDKKITYVLRNCPEYGLMKGYCILGW